MPLFTSQTTQFGLRARLLFWVALAFSPLGAASAIANDVCPNGQCSGNRALSGHTVRAPDEVWFINTRGLRGVTPDGVIRDLHFERYLPEKGWTRSTFADFVVQPAGMVTSFFIVGNYYTHREAIQTGWYAYHRLLSQCADDVAVRFVIWSWPSDPIPGRRLADAKAKLARVDPSALHLAVLIDRLDPATPVSMCGSSFGVGISAGAVQLLAGGKLGCYQLPASERAPRRIRLVMLGAAINNDSLLPGRKYGRVLPYAERTLIFVNPADRALRVYHRLFSRRRTVTALGLSGPVLSPADRSRVDLVSSTAYLGHQHGMLPFWQTPALVAWMRPYLLMQPLASKAASRRR